MASRNAQSIRVLVSGFGLVNFLRKRSQCFMEKKANTKPTIPYSQQKATDPKPSRKTALEGRIFIVPELLFLDAFFNLTLLFVTKGKDRNF